MIERGPSGLSESIEAEAVPFEASPEHSFDDGPELNYLAEMINVIKSQTTDEKTTNFNVLRKISVCFTDCDENSEGAIVASEPTRELFRLLLIHIQDSRIFQGRDTEKYIVFNKEALEKQEYFNT